MRLSKVAALALIVGAQAQCPRLQRWPLLTVQNW